MYQPLQVGREEKEDLGYLCDNTGDNISAENVLLQWTDRIVLDMEKCTHI